MSILAAFMAVACALVAVAPSPAAARVAAISGRDDMAGRRRRGLDLGDRRVLRGIGVAAGLAIAVSWGGILGVVAGVGAALGIPVVIGRMESHRNRERRERMERQSADCAELIAACLSSGAPLAASVTAVADALGPPVAEPLRDLVASLGLGADPRGAWQRMGQEPALAPLARAAARSMETGAPLSDVLAAMSADLRRASHAQIEAAARGAGVRAVAPLAACFLPAFMLLGVVPIVASLAAPFLATLG